MRKFLPLLIAPLLHVSVASAQQVARSWHAVRVKEVNASTIAWWLDPKHNPAPAMVAESAQNRRNGGLPDTIDTTGAFDLPEGVETVAGVDARSEVLVYGTKEGLGRIERLIHFLDKSVARIEITPRFIEVTPAVLVSLSSAGSDKSTALAQAGMGKGFSILRLKAPVVRGLNKMIERKDVRFLQMPVRTVFNSMTSLISTGQFMRVQFDFDESGNLTMEVPSARVQNRTESPLALGKSFALGITPTINSERAVTLALSPMESLVLSPEGTRERLILRNLSQLQTAMQIQDGDTVAITGLSGEFINDMVGERPEPKNAPRDVVLLLTTKIVSPQPSQKVAVLPK